MNILLLEDDESLGQTLKERLSKEGYGVFWCRSVAEATNVYSSENIGLYILDHGLPDGTGFDFVRSHLKGSTRPFIFLTAQTGPSTRLEGYELGASEYIPKPFHLKELLMRVRHVCEEHSGLEELKVGALLINFNTRTITNGEMVHQVQNKDLLVLELIIKESPRVLSRDEILSEVWGAETFPSTRTVDNSILRLRQHLGSTEASRIVSVRGVGYQWIKGDQK